jgi:hypothetical protein
MENETPIPECTRKLSLISEVMADGYHFVNLRFLVEDWVIRAEKGEPYAVEAMDAIDTFYRICSYIKKNEKSL